MKKIFVAVSFCAMHFFATAQTELENTLLWQITGPGISSPSYLYGTIHLMCPDEIKVSDTLRARFYQTKKLFLEIKLDDPSVMLKMMQQMKMKNDTTLQQLLTVAEYDSVEVQFKKLTGMSLSMMNNMKPELLQSLIYPSLLGCKGAEAWEQKFQQLAKANKMEINGLEDVNDQLKIFDEIPYKAQAEELAETLKNIDSAKQNFNTLLTLYKEKNLNALCKMLNEDTELSQYDDILLNNRNKKWIPEIIKQAKLEPAFFAVGAGHLGNANGLINLLKQEGYTVSPVNY
jgi:uncharacterized protein YbaP (TraB family)